VLDLAREQGNTPLCTASTMLTLGEIGLTFQGRGRSRESIHITTGYPA
jgi:hypothetical protein